MVSKKDLKDYEFVSIEEYFDYIITSKVNGQLRQAKVLFAKMSKAQRKDFLDWCMETLPSSDEVLEILVSLDETYID